MGAVSCQVRRLGQGAAGFAPVSRAIEAASVRDGRRPLGRHVFEAGARGQGEVGSLPPFETSFCRMARVRRLGCVPGRVGASPTFGSNMGIAQGAAILCKNGGRGSSPLFSTNTM